MDEVTDMDSKNMANESSYVPPKSPYKPKATSESWRLKRDPDSANRGQVKFVVPKT